MLQGVYASQSSLIPHRTYQPRSVLIQWGSHKKVPTEVFSFEADSKLNMSGLETCRRERQLYDRIKQQTDQREIASELPGHIHDLIIHQLRSRKWLVPPTQVLSCH